MKLTSTLDASIPQPQREYLVLRHLDRKTLVPYPKSSEDLEATVQKAFQIDAGSFFLQTDELNVCKGEWVDIPRPEWGVVLPMVGNVQIVGATPGAVRAIEDAIYPEVPPQGEDVGSYPDDAPNAIKLEEPFVDNAVLVLQPAGINFQSAHGSSPDAHISVLDNDGQPIIALTISPPSGHVVLSSAGLDTQIIKPLKDLFPSETEHSLIIYRGKGQLRLLCDFTVIQFPDSSLATTVVADGVTMSYRFEHGSPFTGPMTANVYSTIADFAKRSPLYAKRFPDINKEGLYRQLSNFDSARGKDISDTLSRIRDARGLFELTTSGISYTAGPSAHSTWNSPICPDNPRCVLGFRLTAASSPVDTSTHNFYLANRGWNVWFQVELKIDERNSILMISSTPGVRQATLDVSDAVHRSTDDLNTILIVERSRDYYVVLNCKTYLSVAKGSNRREGEARWHWHSAASAQFSLAFEVFDFGS